MPPSKLNQSLNELLVDKVAHLVFNARSVAVEELGTVQVSYDTVSFNINGEPTAAVGIVEIYPDMFVVESFRANPERTRPGDPVIEDENYKLIF
jgi:hypothetical protein